MSTPSFNIAVIGAGPAGLFAARELVRAGHQVSLFNRDIKIGGLAEYGIYPDKHSMRSALRNQFRQIIEMPAIHYFGNITIGSTGDISLEALRVFGFDAVIVTVGAQSVKSLGLPGEELPGVYHAKDVVSHYNGLPGFTERNFVFGERAAIVGAGNVMMDIARYLIQGKRLREVTAIVRRGPFEVKFDKKEMEALILNLDLINLDRELARVSPLIAPMGQDAHTAKETLLQSLPNAMPSQSNTRFRLKFFLSPVAVEGTDRVTTLKLEHNKPIRREDGMGVAGTGEFDRFPVDSVIFAVGDKVDRSFGLPMQGNEFAKDPEPRFPQEGISFEAYDPESGTPVDGVFLAGWARNASAGLVGYARKDGTLCARAVLASLEGVVPRDLDQAGLFDRMRACRKSVVMNNDVLNLMMIEDGIASEGGKPGFKFTTNAQMLEHIRSIG